MSRNDSDSWRAMSVRRRDFRAAKDEPEVPRSPRSSHRVSSRTPSRSSSVVCSHSPSGRHVPERYAASVKRFSYEREHDTSVQIRTSWEYRCGYCMTSNIAPQLLGPVCDVLDATTRMRMLAHFWCRQGHLYEVTPPEITGDNGYLDRYNLRRGPRVICLMCGHSKRPQWSPEPPNDLNLYLSAGVPIEVLERILSPSDGHLRTLGSSWEYILIPHDKELDSSGGL